jgi:hypothetical protein
MALADDLRAAEAQVEALKRRIGAATCAQIGEHDWQSIGGCNAGCCKGCTCSVPVHECSRCHDCDYGDNADADIVKARCAAERGEP